MATNFGLANLYNVFVLGNMNMSNTDAEGRVAAGGNVTLYNYGVGAGISPLPPAGTDASLVIDGSVNISGGSNASGNTVVQSRQHHHCLYHGQPQRLPDHREPPSTSPKPGGI